MVCSMETLNRKVLFHTVTSSQSWADDTALHTFCLPLPINPEAVSLSKQSRWTDRAVGMLLHCGDWLESYRQPQEKEKWCDIITWNVLLCETTSVCIEGKVVFEGLIHLKLNSVIIYSPSWLSSLCRDLKYNVLVVLLWNCNKWRVRNTPNRLINLS